MSRTDLAYINYGVPKKAWEWIQEEHDKRLKANPICEICRTNNSTRITGLGTVMACCETCNDNIYKAIEEDIKLSQKINFELGYTDEYGNYY